MTKKEDLILAAKELLWSSGYESMSPARVLKQSGAGQGSLYHHFSGKEALAYAALQDVEKEMTEAAADILLTGGSPVARLRQFLGKDRHGRKGCRIGRLANETRVLESSLREPLEGYFHQLSHMLEQVIDQAREMGELRPDLKSTELAHLIMAAVQGGYVLARATQDETAMTRSLGGALYLLDQVCME